MFDFKDESPSSGIRLTQVAATTSNDALAAYAYTLGPAGNRTGVVELTGRAVAYGYDDVYRLTSETISALSGGTFTCGGNGQNCGTVGYTYDTVGNRKGMTSTLGAVPAGLFNYDANDRLGLDTYDNDGNTVSSAGIQNQYDFENHLIQHGAVTIVYDGDGNRVSETVGGVTTNYLVDTQNPTGYAQVMEELQSGSVERSYTWGHWLLAKLETGNSQLSYYGYDGHGSVRFLTDSAGIVTDTYDYDAFGNLINSTGSTLNNYLFAGEQYDTALGLYYNRARYLDVRTGRFWGMDSFEGDAHDPATLHKYLFTADNPTNRLDPSGHDFTIGSVTITLSFQGTIFGLSTASSVLVMQGVLGGLLAASTAGFGAYLEGGSPAQIEEATGNLFNIAFGTILGITGSRIAALGVGRVLLSIAALDLGGGAAARAYKAGNTGAALYYTLLTIGSVAVINIAGGTGSGTRAAGEAELLYRGVASDHPAFGDAVQGTANPRGGAATPAEHNLGNTQSEYTSWTRDVFTARQFAGEDGVVLMKQIPKSQLIDSPDLFGEQEVLVKGSVSGATVLRKQ